MHRSAILLVVMPFLLPAAPAAKRVSLAQAGIQEDEEVLRSAGLPTDGPGLVDYVRKQTLTSAQHQWQVLRVQQLGDPAFRTREQASAELVAQGPRALPALRHALGQDDAEIRRRAQECIDTIERACSPAALAAAIRLLRARRPSEATEVLLAYLPQAEDSIEAELIESLRVLGFQAGKSDAALVSALQDVAPSRRAVAALLLGAAGTVEQRATVRGLLTDAHPKVRLYAARGLIAGRDRTAVPVLLDLLTDGPPNLAREAEEVLLAMAGEWAPDGNLGTGDASRRQCRQAWETWWKSNQGRLNLARADANRSAATLARRAAQRFINALVQGSPSLLRSATDVPFYAGPEEKLGSRAELTEFFKSILVDLRRERLTLVITGVSRCEDYLKQASDNEKEFLRQAGKSRVRIVSVRVKVKGAVEYAVVFVRLAAGRARVIGIGEGTSEKSAGN